MKRLLKIINLMEQNIELRKEKDKLEMQIYEINEEYEKYKRELKKQYEKMDSRNNTLSKDNRILMTTMRKKDKEIAELKKKLEEYKNVEEYQE